MSLLSVLRRAIGLGATPKADVGPPVSLRVLIVDDEGSVRDSLSRLLTARGHATVTAASAADALGHLHTEQFDVMLCDVRMPVVSGIDLVPEVLDIDPDLPVLMLTGVNDLATAKLALSAGAANYLVKPVELAELEDALQRAARHREINIVRRARLRPDLRD
jgi:DNA-binding NtrC family response regulator